MEPKDEAILPTLGNHSSAFLLFLPSRLAEDSGMSSMTTQIEQDHYTAFPSSEKDFNMKKIRPLGKTIHL